MRSLRSLNDLKSTLSRLGSSEHVEPNRSSQSFSTGDGDRKGDCEKGERAKGGSELRLSCINFRDCGMISESLNQGFVYRSSQVVSSSELRKLELKAVLDLRVMKKPCKKQLDDFLVQVKRTESMIKSAGKGSNSGSSDEEGDSGIHAAWESCKQWKANCKECTICTRDFAREHGVTVPIYHSDLVPAATKLHIFGALPAKTKLKAMGEICHLRNPEQLVAAAVVDPKVMGPSVLYKLLLDHSKTSMAKALRVFAKRENYPVMVHCIHGKDRTGLIIMLLLLICDVPSKLVVADYIQSELQLKSGRDKGDLHELDDFLQSDNVIASKADTMVETITHIDQDYGGVRGYCKAIGLSDEEIAHIRTNFMKQANHSDLFDRYPGNAGGRHSESNSSSYCGRPSPTLGEDCTIRHGDCTVSHGRGEPQQTNPDWPILEGATQQSHKDAQPAQPTQHTYHDETVLSDVAMQAADEAIEDRLNDLDIKPKGLRPQRSEGAISIEKLNPSSPSREQSGMQAQSAPPRHLMDS